MIDDAFVHSIVFFFAKHIRLIDSLSKMSLLGIYVYIKGSIDLSFVHILVNVL